MKFKFLLVFLLISCTPELNSNISKSTYTTSGFAYIYDEFDQVNKVTSKKFNNEELLIGHNKLRAGKLLRITNPENKKSIVLKIKKKTKYPEFYKILLTESVANRLKLNKKVPFVEIQEIKKNKSFIAEKAKTFEEEKKVINKVPIKSVKIQNISKTKSRKKPKIKNFLIIIAEFYSLESALFLKERIAKEMTNFNNKKLSIKKKGKKSFELLSGPYNAVNSLKNDYIVLKKYGFEELDVRLLNE
tara:strand:+ start:412 stop:1146 length:735 start_codon:yes stop_codon:yes gene_type:complete